MISGAVANAIRDFEYIGSLDHLSDAEKKTRYGESRDWFKTIRESKKIDPFESRAYRRLRNTRSDPHEDDVRRLLLTFLPSPLTWTKEEKKLKKELYEGRKHQPTTPSSSATLETADFVT